MTPEEKEKLYAEFRKRLLGELCALSESLEDFPGFFRMLYAVEERPAYFVHALSCKICEPFPYAETVDHKCDEGARLWESRE